MEFEVDDRNSSCVCTVVETDGQGSISQRNVHDLAALVVFTMYMYRPNTLPSATVFPFSRVLPIFVLPSG